MAKALSAIVTFTDKPEIFGKETVCISNGIDFEAIPLKKKTGHPDGQIHLLAVAEVHYWHAYDRILTGLGEYYRQPHDREVFLHIVGGLGQYEQQLFDRLIQEYSTGSPYTVKSREKNWTSCSTDAILPSAASEGIVPGSTKSRR